MATRQEVAAALASKKAEAEFRSMSEPQRRMALGAEPMITAPDPRTLRPKEPGDPGPALPVPNDLGRRVDLGAPLPPEVEAAPNIGENPGVGDAETIKRNTREVLNVVSGGATEAIGSAVAGAPAAAANQVTAADLQSMTPQQLQALMAQADPEGTGSATFVRTPAGWQPGTRTGAKGETGKDPDAIRAAMKLQDVAEGHSLGELSGRQEAERNQYETLHRIQQNEMKATQAFKAEADAREGLYQKEREVQTQRLMAVQRAMDKAPDAPRTIRAWLDKSGTGDKIAYGLAAAFSILGGGMSKDGGASVQRMNASVQGNIDRNVQKEADEYARLGKRADMANNIYAHIRSAVQDDRQAQNLTKALYYDAAKNAIEQTATQYKLDMQSPQIQEMLGHLARERQKLIMDTASTMQDQTSQTDKYSPGGLVQVGGAKKKDQYDSEPLAKGLAAYGEAVEKRGGNSATRAIALYQKAQQEMKEGGFANDEHFLSVFAAMNSAENPALQAAILSKQNLNPKQRAALQHVIDAGAEQLKDESGKSVTANELARDVMKKGGYSITSLDAVRDTLAKKRENIYATVDGTHGGKHNIIGDTYRARQRISEVERKNPGIGTDAPQPVDPGDLATRVEGRLNQ